MKILDLIPENLHEQLFKEVAEALEEKKKKEAEDQAKKQRSEVSEMMKEYLEDRKQSKS